MKYKTIRLQKEDKVALLTLHRPASLHTINSLVLREMRTALEEIERDESVRALVLTGGEHCFSAGFDIGEINELATAAEIRLFFRDARAVFDLVEDLERPVIAAVGGLALGGGCELTLACDLRIAAANATFGQPEIKIGMIPAGGGTQRLPRLIGMTRAKELLFTGDHIDALEAQRLGLVNRVVAAGSLLDEAMQLAAKIAGRPPQAIEAIKLAVNGGVRLDMKAAIALESRCFDNLVATDEWREGIVAYVEKRKPVDPGR